MAKKATSPSLVGDVADESVQSDLTVAEILALEPKRSVRIPQREGVKQRFVVVSINGHTFQIARGSDVEVPQTVYEVLANAGEI